MPSNKPRQRTDGVHSRNRGATRDDRDAMPAEPLAPDGALPQSPACMRETLESFARLPPAETPPEGATVPLEIVPTPAPAKPPQVVGPGQPAPPAPAFVPLSGGYKLIKRLGAGGFAEVWMAEAPGGFPAAVKKIFHALDHEEAQRELASLEAVRRLSHPFLLQTQAYWATEGQLWIAMELAECSLRDRLKECRGARQQGIPAMELLRYMREAAEALDYLHSEMVQHRDIKPGNILLLRGHAKVADFGLARLQQRAVSETATTSGTPAYMPPEAWVGRLHPNSDQYSLAVTYVELRLGRRPFTGASPAELMVAHLQNTPDLAPLSPQEQGAILQALASEPADRFSSCGEFIHALQVALDVSTARHASQVTTEHRRVGQSSCLWSVIILATLLALALAILLVLVGWLIFR